MRSASNQSLDLLEQPNSCLRVGGGHVEVTVEGDHDHLNIMSHKDLTEMDLIVAEETKWVVEF